MSVYQATFSFATAPERPLSRFQRQVLDFIRSRSHLAQGVCQATKTLADHFGVSVRYVQVALRELRLRGLIERLWDYELRTRRRFKLAPEPEQPLTSNSCAQSAHSSALTAEIPPDPPIEVSGESEKRELAASAEPPPPQPPVGPPSEEPRKPTTEEIDRIKARAEKLFGRGGWTRGLLYAAARRSGRWSSVEYVLCRLEEEQRGGRLRTTPARFFWGVLALVIAEGGPPPDWKPPLTTEQEEARIQAAIEAIMANVRANP